ncbi:hypothetical protein KIPB_005046 [Kipferlia bialata]|uniref:Uncharacterized protein n=1 Tax=Kipferlia bialata TaxID=797122 RepID=A0A9K3CWG0_9EUKA|nr:hypothetical protein KIPB_005046 [Kipferlia bialata]|eukprot:g5046.t1
MARRVKAPHGNAGAAPEGYEHSGLDASMWSRFFKSLSELMYEIERQTGRQWDIKVGERILNCSLLSTMGQRGKQCQCNVTFTQNKAGYRLSDFKSGVRDGRMHSDHCTAHKHIHIRRLGAAPLYCRHRIDPVAMHGREVFCLPYGDGTPACTVSLPSTHDLVERVGTRCTLREDWGTPLALGNRYKA